MIADTLKTLAPLPWSARVDDELDRWGLSVSAGDGKNVSERMMTRDEARFLAAIHAFAPVAMIYVQQAAERGGTEARLILNQFERAVMIDPTPEAIARQKQQRTA